MHKGLHNDIHKGLHDDIIKSSNTQHVSVYWLLNVTINDISFIHVTAHRCAGGLKKKLNLKSGCQRHRHFVEFFNVPVQAPTWGHPFYGYSEKPPHSYFNRHLRSEWGYGGPILIFNPRIPMGATHLQWNLGGGGACVRVRVNESTKPWRWQSVRNRLPNPSVLTVSCSGFELTT